MLHHLTKLALAVGLVLCLSLPADAAPAAQPDKKEDRKDDRKPATPEEQLQQLLEEQLRGLLQGGGAPGQEFEFLQKILEMQFQQLQQLQGAQPGQPDEFRQLFDALQMFQNLQNRQARPVSRRVRVDVRFGATLEPISDTLVKQLDLKEGQGQVVSRVMPGSAAEKAGLETHDILLELNGKPAASNAAEFARAVDEIKADTAVDAVVLRKGKKTEVKGLKLPEAPPAVNARPNLFRIQPIQFPVIPINAGNVNRGVRINTTTNGNDFTTTFQEGTLAIRVQGTMENGERKVKEIKVTDTGVESSYESVDQVPEIWRDKVKSVVEQAGKNGVRIRFNDR